MIFWHLLLAHFLADYPLQTNWIARNKQRLPVLALHVLIHLLVMAVIMGGALARLWLFVLGIGAVHFVLDVIKVKKVYQRWNPGAVIFPYLLDQFLHVLTIATAAFWIGQTYPGETLLLGNAPAACALGLVLVTRFWHITEIVITARSPLYQAQVIRQGGARMVSRALMFAILLITAGIALPVGSRALLWAVPLLGVTLRLPYDEAQSRVRAVVTDMVVALCCAALARAAMRI